MGTDGETDLNRPKMETDWESSPSEAVEVMETWSSLSDCFGSSVFGEGEDLSFSLWVSVDMLGNEKGQQKVSRVPSANYFYLANRTGDGIDVPLTRYKFVSGHLVPHKSNREAVRPGRRLMHGRLPRNSSSTSSHWRVIGVGNARHPASHERP